MIIHPVPEAEATGDVARVYQEDIDEVGYVPSHTKAMALNPQAWDAFHALTRAAAKPLGLRRFELVTLAAARATGSPHCRLAHGAKSLRAGLFEADQLERIARDPDDAGLTDAEVAMMAYAERVASDPRGMTDADTQRLRDAGFSDAEIVDVTVAAAARVYLGVALQALAVEPDVPPILSPAVREALVEGL
ncbi:carboxymuconolactone decarboxylase family protein [Agromyces sp. MMS24-K17]|uniref:carboxymuconolactone decarboxylase family protein n=1 Tax=Agromyces sp. MMS24-K17 TaxID=3372850 RepID=UPI003755312D